MIQLYLNREEDTLRLALVLARVAYADQVLAMIGDLGSGKSFLTRALAHALGVKEDVSSPTFTIMRDYALPEESVTDGSEEKGIIHSGPQRLSRPQRLYHIDAYRLRGASDFVDQGFAELMDAGGLMVIEWANLIEAALPERAWRMHFVVEDADEKNEAKEAGETADFLAWLQSDLAKEDRRRRKLTFSCPNEDERLLREILDEEAWPYEEIFDEDFGL